MSLGSDPSIQPLAWPSGSLGGALGNYQLPGLDPIATTGKHFRELQAAHLVVGGRGLLWDKRESHVSKNLLSNLPPPLVVSQRDSHVSPHEQWGQPPPAEAGP